MLGCWMLKIFSHGNLHQVFCVSDLPLPHQLGDSVFACLSIEMLACQGPERARSRLRNQAKGDQVS